jgi:alpha-L-fucosidase
MATYDGSSPYYRTKSEGIYLDRLKIRPVPAEPDDFLYEIKSQYTYRPDLLSFDVYGTPKLWWVFMQRNMDTIKDPIWDFVAGTKIYLPKKSTLFQTLGI